MRLVFIRHGDPDYINDTITAEGRMEARLLAEHVDFLHLEHADFYVSPLGRAQDTAAYVLNKLGKTARTMEFLKEFPAVADITDSESLQMAYPDTQKDNEKYTPRIIWDMVPAYWTSHEEYFDREGWKHSELSEHSDILQVYDRVTKEFDAFLASYGYVREGRHYRVEKENDITVVCFCHLGITCVLLSYLWNVSPVILLHSLAMAPTSVTEVYTEERQKGTAYFRATRIGDISHLNIGGKQPSFMGRYCEVYSNPDQRH